MDEMEHLPITVLREPKVKLRDVNRESIEFLEMCDSIRDHGILQPLLVRPIADGTDGAGADGTDRAYEIVEGMYRYSAAKEVGLEEVPCLIRQCSDDEALVLMLAANAISPETKLAEYGQQLKRLMARNPDMTQGSLACLIRKSPKWISTCLALTHLLAEIQVMVNRGEIPVENAYMLAKIPRHLQMEYVDRAKLKPSKEFRPIAAACVKQFMEAVKRGKMQAFYEADFKAVAHLRSLKEIEEEMLRKNRGALLVTGEGCQTALDGFYAGLRWACHLDRQSAREQEEEIRKRRERQVLDVQLI